MTLLSAKSETPVRNRAHLLVSIVAIFLLIPAIALALDCGSIEPVTLIPGDDACTGFTLSGEPDLAHSFEELAVFINGDAAMYVQYGFVASAFQSYAVDLDATVTSADVKIFNQGNADNAEDLFYYTNDGIWDEIPGWAGSGVVRLRQSFGNTYLEFQEECAFVRITILGLDSQAAADGARCLGETICAAIQLMTPATETTWSEVKTDYR